MATSKRVTLPTGIRVTEEGRILYFWRRWIGLAMVVGSILGSFPFLSDPNLLSDILSPPLRFIELVPFTILLPIIAFAYWGLGWVVNRTELFVEQGTFFIQHKPLPWMGNTSIPIYEIAEIRVDKKWKGEGYTEKHIIIYSLNVIKKSGTTMKLISSIRELDQAASLKQELQKLLGISEPDLLSRVF